MHHAISPLNAARPKRQENMKRNPWVLATLSAESFNKTANNSLTANNKNV
jgi:hypothetical protein